MAPARAPKPRLSHEDYSIGWICALDIELTASLEMFDKEHETLDQPNGDNNSYFYGRIGKHNVVMTCLAAGRIGTNSASTVASQMFQSFPKIRPDRGLLVGVAGGVPSDKNDIRLGDIIVTQEIMESANDRRLQYPKSRDRLFEATYDHVRDRDTCDLCDPARIVQRVEREHNYPEIHYGTIASGNTVMKDAIKRDRIGSEYEALCFEMEAAGAMNILQCLVIRGICDYSDSHKNGEWQAYAALVAAIYARKFICNLPREADPESERRAQLRSKAKAKVLPETKTIPEATTASEDEGTSDAETVSEAPSAFEPEVASEAEEASEAETISEVEAKLRDTTISDVETIPEAPAAFEPEVASETEAISKATNYLIADSPPNEYESILKIHPNRTSKDVTRFPQDFPKPIKPLQSAPGRDLATFGEIMSENERAQACKILRWVAFAARPLSTLELTEGLLAGTANNKFRRKGYPSVIEASYVQNNILEVYRSLAKVKEGGDQTTFRGESSKNFLLAQLSIGEFLLGKIGFETALDERMAHCDIGSACISYLASEVVQQRHYQQLGPIFRYLSKKTPKTQLHLNGSNKLSDATSPSLQGSKWAGFTKGAGFLEYAAREWLKHARSYESLANEVLPCLRTLLLKEGVEELRFLLFFYYFDLWGYQFDPMCQRYIQAPILALSSGIKLPGVVKVILNHPDPSIPRDKRTGLKAIKYACDSGDLDTLDLLLEHYSLQKIPLNMSKFSKLIHSQPWRGTQKVCAILEVFIRHGLNRRKFVGKLVPRRGMDTKDICDWILRNKAEPLDLVYSSADPKYDQHLRPRLPQNNSVHNGLSHTHTPQPARFKPSSVIHSE
ncbi:hypothetical protein ABW19_dt0200051 [Dactylella cylindrospora]|nr:hypothetical protein ABW19_dt0200051 [Dactylella cylindrospora]